MNEKNNKIQRIDIEKLIDHPGNPNHMSSGTFAKLVRNIEQTGRYEPIVIRAVCSVPRSALGAPRMASNDKQTKSSRNDTNTQSLGLLTENAGRGTQYQIINGHHRVKALRQLGFKTADCLIWDVDDNEADILLATLNRLAGTDELDKKLALLRRLSHKTKTSELAKILPLRARQIERLNKLKPPRAAANIKQASFLNPLTFFVNDSQCETIRRAMSLAAPHGASGSRSRAAALTRIAESFIKTNSSATTENDKRKTPCSNLRTEIPNFRFSNRKSRQNKH